MDIQIQFLNISDFIPKFPSKKIDRIKKVILIGESNEIRMIVDKDNVVYPNWLESLEDSDLEYYVNTLKYDQIEKIFEDHKAAMEQLMKITENYEDRLSQVMNEINKIRSQIEKDRQKAQEKAEKGKLDHHMNNRNTKNTDKDSQPKNRTKNRTKNKSRKQILNQGQDPNPDQVSDKGYLTKLETELDHDLEVLIKQQNQKGKKVEIPEESLL